VRKDFCMIGYSHLFGDIVDCISSVGGRLFGVFLNVPEAPKKGRPTLHDRLKTIRDLTGWYDLGQRKLSEMPIDTNRFSYVLGFSRAQAEPLLQQLRTTMWIFGQPPLIHKSVTIQIGACVGDWSIVNAAAILGSCSRIGRHVIVNRGSSIGHDVRIGDHCFIAPSAVLCSHVQLGEDVLVGANATILPDVHVGNGASIGAGAVVVEDVPMGATVVGVPAKELVKR